MNDHKCVELNWWCLHSSPGRLKLAIVSWLGSIVQPIVSTMSGGMEVKSVLAASVASANIHIHSLAGSSD